MNQETGMNKPRFVWAFDLGQVLQMLSFAVTLAGFVWWQSSVQTEMRRDILALQAGAATVAPKMNEMARSDDVQNERISAISESVRNIQTTSSALLTQMGGVREDLAGIKGRLGPTH